MCILFLCVLTQREDPGKCEFFFLLVSKITPNLIPYFIPQNEQPLSSRESVHRVGHK